MGVAACVSEGGGLESLTGVIHTVSLSHNTAHSNMERLQEEEERRSSLSGIQKQLDNLEDADYESQPVIEEKEFFCKGRDLQSTTVNHQYTQAEREVLASYDSMDYLPPHSQVYSSWLSTQPARLDWDRWMMMGLIGFFTGITGFLLHQIIDVIANFKWKFAQHYITVNDFGLAWFTVTSYSLFFVLMSTAIVVLFRPSAAGSGMPELIGFLNGTMIRHIFNIKTYVVKFISCSLAVGAGMPVGPEGPMIHLGSLVGAGLSQFQSKTLGIKLPFFERFRNSEDRRNFISAGAAAGIASAFGAPVGGLLFAMEEVSSFWSMSLSWQVLFCSMVSTFTTDLFNSAFTGFVYTGDFGQFKTEKYILFQIDSAIDLNILGVIPSMILGILGGLLGSLFIFINLKMARFRSYLRSRVTNQIQKKIARMAEPVIVILITCTISVLVPLAFNDCTMFGDTSTIKVGNFTCPEGQFSPAATLFFTNGDDTIQRLLSRSIEKEFGYGILFTFLGIYFILACWASGTQISCGLVVPMLLIGSLYGRILGRITVDIFGVQTGSYWQWMNPGAFALLGGVSFFGGVTRLTMSLAVIMVEITNDIQFLLLIIVTILFSKWTGDLFTHSIYHSLLEFKCIPFLDAIPVLIKEDGKAVSLETHRAREVMASPVRCLHEVEDLTTVVNLLQDTEHGGFPVLSQTGTFEGLITRFELLTVLCKAFTSRELESGKDIKLEIAYPAFSAMRGGRLSDNRLSKELLTQARGAANRAEEGIRIDLRNFVNKSAMSVHERFSLQRTYTIFRSLGLRHLVVVNDTFKVTGIITRKDLMGFSIEEKLLNGGGMEA